MQSAVLANSKRASEFAWLLTESVVTKLDRSVEVPRYEATGHANRALLPCALSVDITGRRDDSEWGGRRDAPVLEDLSC